MDEKKSISSSMSWNPLNYSQNLCVVSKSGNGINETVGKDSLDLFEVNQQLSALNIETNSNDSIDGNNEMIKLMNHLIATNGRDYGFEYKTDSSIGNNMNGIKSNINNVLIGNRFNIGYDNNANNCGDIPFINHNKYEYQLNGINANQSVINSMPFFPTQEHMFSQNYPNIQLFGEQLGSINRSSSQQMSNQLTQQLSQQNTSESLVMNQPSVRPKLQPMAYNENQSYTQLIATTDSSQQESSHQTSRHFRSIRARNSTNNSMEGINKLNYYLDKCYEQYKHLEKERRKIEFDLSQAFCGQKISSANNIPIQRPPQNATKIDRLITNMSREHAKVITIIAKMEQLRGNSEFKEGIHNSIERWLDIIRKLQIKRKDQILSNTAHFSNSGPITESFVGQISQLVKELTATVRSVRTSLWSAYVCTLFEKSS